MAEGDSIRRLADRLDVRLSGGHIVASTIRHNRYAGWDLADRRLCSIDARGKHLLMYLDGGATRITVHSHLRMSGRWTVGVPPRTPANRRRIELGFSDGRVLVGSDLPVLHVGRQGDEQRWVGHLGPDLCAAAFDGRRATENLVAAAGQPLGQALLDQRIVAGIGNLYAVELPFLVGVSPWHAAGDVTGGADLLRVARALLTANVAIGQQSTTGLVHRRSRHWIYRRGRRPCAVCATPLASAADAPWGRATWWCTACQRAGVVDLDRARHLLRRHRIALEHLAATW